MVLGEPFGDAINMETEITSPITEVEANRQKHPLRQINRAEIKFINFEAYVPVVMSRGEASRRKKTKTKRRSKASRKKS